MRSFHLWENLLKKKKKEGSIATCYLLYRTVHLCAISNAHLQKPRKSVDSTMLKHGQHPINQTHILPIFFISDATPHRVS